MALKRKTRNLPDMNDEMSFFDPVYQNGDIDDLGSKNESNETLDTDTIVNNDEHQPPEMISASRIFLRIKQIQNSIEQAQAMLASMEKFQNLPDANGQREKLCSIIANLEQQQAGYVNLLNRINLTNDERSPEDDDDLSLRRNVQTPNRPRIESKIGFIPPTSNLSDNEQTTRNDNSNYDSLVGSLKSDTINWKDQQSTSADEASDVESEKEIERNLMIHKEQLRALQGQKRALMALKRRSEQQLTNKKSAIPEEDKLLTHINSLRNRIQLLRSIYEQRTPTQNRLENLEHVRERLDDLEQIVACYQTDKETSILSDDVQHTETLVQQNTTPQHLDKLSSDLVAKRLELEQAKSALNQLQQMVKTIQPNEHSSSAGSTPLSKTKQTNRKTSLLSNILSPSPTTNKNVDAKMTAQHREIERLVESRQRLHTIKDQIESLHQSMTTPPIQKNSYEDNLNDSKNLRPVCQQECLIEDENDSEFCQFEDDSDTDIQTKPRMKQSNFCASKTRQDQQSDELHHQMREICRCLSTFIDEQKSFNRHIEERLTSATNPPTDPVFNQLQQQVLTQGLIVNLNTAYREIAVLQSEINALQSENNRLASSISFDNQYHHYIPHSYEENYSRESLYSGEQLKSNNRPQPRSAFDEQQTFENSSKTSFNSQSTGKQTAIHVNKTNIETTPNKQEQNATLSAEYITSPKPRYFRSKYLSNSYDLSNYPRRPPRENVSKSFVIRRRPLSTENKNNYLYNYKQKLDEQATLSSLDDDQQLNKVFNIQPASYYTSTTENGTSVDTQTLDLQVKAAMVQLIPYMRLHINEIFNQSILKHIRERILFLFKQQPDSAQLMRYFQNQFSELIEKTIEKYCGTTIRECAADLIRDVSDIAFEELVKYKTYEQETIQNTDRDEYDEENDNKYRIELAESENRPLTLIGSDEENNDSDQEENQDDELETAVSRQESDLNEDQSPSSSESNSNGHEYVLVNRSASNDNVPENEQND